MTAIVNFQCYSSTYSPYFKPFSCFRPAPPRPNMEFGLDPRPLPRPPRPPLPPIFCGLSPVTSSASSAASFANTASLSDAFVSSACLLASRASLGFVSVAVFDDDASAASAASQHSRHRCFPGPFWFNCLFENANAGFDSPHFAHSCVVSGVPLSDSLSFTSVR